ncbi:MAG: hypothetical protein EOO38_12305, partial [Cytophagaceae bacterium]
MGTASRRFMRVRSQRLIVCGVTHWSVKLRFISRDSDLVDDWIDPPIPAKPALIAFTQPECFRKLSIVNLRGGGHRQ